MAIRILLSRKLGEVRWTQADLARRTGIRPSTINDMYHEMCDRVNIEYLDRICNVLNCDLTELLVYDPPKDREEVIKAYRIPDKTTKGWGLVSQSFVVSSNCLMVYPASMAIKIISSAFGSQLRYLR